MYLNDHELVSQGSLLEVSQMSIWDVFKAAVTGAFEQCFVVDRYNEVDATKCKKSGLVEVIRDS